MSARWTGRKRSPGIVLVNAERHLRRQLRDAQRRGYFVAMHAEWLALHTIIHAHDGKHCCEDCSYWMLRP